MDPTHAPHSTGGKAPRDPSATAAVRHYADVVRSAVGLDEAPPISYAGLWLLLASLAEVVEDEGEFRDVIGMSTTRAVREARALLDAPHPTVAAALGAWRAAWAELSEELPIALEELPPQSTLDTWAAEQTRGLITHFPVEIKPETMLLFASALVLTPRWSHGVDRERSGRLRVTDGIQAVVSTSAGPVAVVSPPTDDQVDVISVIARADVPAAQVWEATDEVVALLVAGELENNSFPATMGEAEIAVGHAWTTREVARTFTGRVPDEGALVWQTHVPQWSQTAQHDLSEAPGVRLVSEPIQRRVPEPTETACLQAAMARYDEEGFAAAAVTALEIRAVSFPMVKHRTVRQVEVTFDRPHALIAVARGGAWEGVPLFHAWVTA